MLNSLAKPTKFLRKTQMPAEWQKQGLGSCTPDISSASRFPENLSRLLYMFEHDRLFYFFGLF